mmetsp:Transcript_7901/g.28031  ORF Transcript_7901/g.28031 Transcript_7901/m.28031 type:complete len:329 (-) Transcript_7901:93-1079(-)
MGDLWWTPERALLWSWVVTCGIQGSCFLIAAKCKFDKITDFAGSMNFIIIALMSLIIGDWYSARQIILVAEVLICRFELAIFLLMRVLKRGKDDRFDEVREHFCRFFGFWVFQAIWAWTCTAPAVLACAMPADAPLDYRDFVGIAVFVVGVSMQFLADYQKSEFRANPANKGKFCDVGIWSWSRHPNYWGEILIWTGIFVGSLAATDNSIIWAGLMSPLYTLLILLGFSGAPIAESESNKRYGRGANAEAYAEWRRATSPIVVMPQCLYRVLPGAVRLLCCCEFPCYAAGSTDVENPLGAEAAEKATYDGGEALHGEGDAAKGEAPRA